MTKTAKSPAPAARRNISNAPSKSAKPAGTASQPKLSIQDLRVTVEKLEKLNATLRVKSRNDRRAASEAHARVETLETELASLKAKAEAPAKPAKAAPVKSSLAKPAKAKRSASPAPSDEPAPADQEPAMPAEA